MREVQRRVAISAKLRAYRDCPISWWVFLVAGSLALIVALATIGFQSIKAALMNPVKSLRNE